MEREEKEGKRDVRSKWKESHSGVDRVYRGRPYYSDSYKYYGEPDGARRRKIDHQQDGTIRYREGGSHSAHIPYMPYPRVWVPHGPHPGNRYETGERKSLEVERPTRGYEGTDPSSYKNERYALKAKRNGSPSRAIGIFGLGAHITEDDVRDLLKERISEILNYRVVIVYDKYKRMSKGYGFVQFDSVDDAITARNRLVGQTIKGKEIRVDYSIE